MNWRSINFDWNKAKAFLVTVEEGSLSAAAQALGTTQPTVGRQISALEKELAVALFERQGRSLVLTANGMTLFEHVKNMGKAATNLSLTASGQSKSIEGTVCITATEDAAVFQLPAIVKKLRQKYPKIQVEILASNKTINLRRREADIALRAYRPTQTELIAKKIKNQHGYFYASKDYIKKLGYPSCIENLNEAEFIGFNSTSSLIDYLNAMGLSLTNKNVPWLSENRMVQWEMVKLGVGIGLLPDYIGDSASDVAKVLPHQQPFEGELWLVAHRELRMNRRMRVVFDFLAKHLSV